MVNLAEAVKDRINAGTYSAAVTAEREYRPAPDLSALQGVKCYVVPESMAANVSTRASDQFTPMISVTLHKGGKGNADLDAMMVLAEEVFDQLRGVSYTITEGRCSWQGAENETLFLSSALDELQVFSTRITVSFFLIRSR